MDLIFLNRFFYPDHSATSQLLTDLAIHLATRGHRVRVVASRQAYVDAMARLPAKETVRGIKVYRVWSTCFGRVGLAGRAIDYLTFSLSAGWRLRRLARNGELVVVMTDPPLASVLAQWALAGRRTRRVNWLQDLFPEVAEALAVRGLSGRIGRWARHARDRSLCGAVVNVAIGERMAERVRAAGVSGRRVRVIHNWADAEAIRPLARQANRLRCDWGLEDAFVVGYSGNLGRAHTYTALLQAAQLLDGLGTVDEVAAQGSTVTDPVSGNDVPVDGRGPSAPGAAATAGAALVRPVVFLVIGGGLLWRTLRAEVARLGLRNVRFVPYQERAALHLSLGVADVHWISLRPTLEGLVVPSKFYGVAAAGRPVLFVGDADGEIARLLAAHDCGLAVAEGDGAGFAAAVRRWRDDAAFWERQGANARRLLEDRFAQERALAQWEHLLGEVAAPPRSRPWPLGTLSG
ncbi:glycosyltransferase family 4 protein [uncultured Thiodictyon sp.]|uniref:glycosyltransferase family 4 protein n=1 Tax=uncultured Thiodictyon sp. TaxID=1846217 RepID=UPI0025CF5AF2|nr:glycosyltransferase family 4 protein [uncultured Thiodictyon sp.]